jgi:hypothetical protein
VGKLPTNRVPVSFLCHAIDLIIVSKILVEIIFTLDNNHLQVILICTGVREREY